MSDGEQQVRDFHDARPGVTPSALARGGSYELLAARVRAGARVLDLACGDGHLLEQLGARAELRAVGVDLSRGELAAARRRADGANVVQARAQALPFARGAFDVVTCHLALMLFDDLPRVADELARVLAPGGELIAILGGGPVAALPAHEGDERGDAFHHWLDVTRDLRAQLAPITTGDPRASREAGWRELFEPRGFAVAPFERIEIDLSGGFDQIWHTLATTYDGARIASEPGEPGEHIREAFRASLADCTRADGAIELRMVLWLATARGHGRD